MFKLKPLSKEAIPAAIDRAKRYRLLGQPWHAESICRDVMATEPDNQQNLIILILAITDQFASEKNTRGIADAMRFIELLKDKYQKDYAMGIIYERLAWAAINRQTPHSGHIAYSHLMDAMKYYEQSQKSHPEKNEESVLRWNTCVRMIEQFNLKPSQKEQGVEMLE